MSSPPTPPPIEPSIIGAILAGGHALSFALLEARRKQRIRADHDAFAHVVGLGHPVLAGLGGGLLEQRVEGLSRGDALVRRARTAADARDGAALLESAAERGRVAR